jgi:hypothetical protein
MHKKKKKKLLYLHTNSSKKTSFLTWKSHVQYRSNKVLNIVYCTRIMHSENTLTHIVTVLCSITYDYFTAFSPVQTNCLLISASTIQCTHVNVYLAPVYLCLPLPQLTNPHGQLTSVCLRQTVTVVQLPLKRYAT